MVSLNVPIASPPTSPTPAAAGIVPLALIVTALAMLAVACGSGALEAPPFDGVIAASDFAVGINRVPFVLANVDGERIEGADVRVRFSLLTEDGAHAVAEVDAAYYEIEGVTPHVHEDGLAHEHRAVRGFYVADGVDLDEAGVWQMAIEVTSNPSILVSVGPAFSVGSALRAPGVGEAVPATENPTIRDVATFAEISTRLVARDDLHQLSVAQAIAAARPFVVVFASPRFCVTAICGPVTDVVADVQRRYGDRANFIHIEPWELIAARDEGRLIASAAMSEWRLPSEPWTFVVAADGRVGARFEGLVAGQEIERALNEALRR